MATNDSSSKREFLYFPTDVVLEILLWLPVISLLRFKSACKSWYDLIESPVFIRRHLLRIHRRRFYNDDDHNLLILRVYNSPIDFLLVHDRDFQLHQPIQFPDILRPPAHNLDVVTCDGLVCILHRDSPFLTTPLLDFILWNPATKRSRALPRSDCVHQDHLPFFGFGRDIVNNDYKIVILCMSHPCNSFSFPNHCMVYSLADDSWTTTDVVLPDDVARTYRPGTYWNGFCLWIGSSYCEDDVNDKHCLVSFDFSKEVFDVMPLPDSCKVMQGLFPYITVLRGNIACVEEVVSEPAIGTNWERLFDIWMLGEFGVEDSWTKVYTLGPYDSDGVCGFLKFIKNGDYLLFYQFLEEERLSIYNFNTQEMKTLVEGENLRDYIEDVPYLESLVSVKGGTKLQSGHD